jgi:hypothetical protein
MTFAYGSVKTIDIETSAKNEVRRVTGELSTELRNLFNKAIKEICQRQDYWFLEPTVTFTLVANTQDYPVATPLDVLFDSPIMGYYLGTGLFQRQPLDFLTIEQALIFYPVVGVAGVPKGPPEAFSPNEDFTKIRIYPSPTLIGASDTVSIRYVGRTFVAVQLDADTNFLINFFPELCVAWLKWKCFEFLGENNRAAFAKAECNELAKITLDRENKRKKLIGAKVLKIKKGALEISREGPITGRRTFLA